MKNSLVAFVLSLFCSAAIAAPMNQNDRLWEDILTANVHSHTNGRSTTIDYSQLKQQPAPLTLYLASVATTDRASFDGWSKNRQLAFLINVYNAATVALVLTEYPSIKSIKEIGSFFQSPWKQRFITLFDEKYTLDEIEHQLIIGSGRYNDPRVHFAVNCASIGCPALRAEAYTEDKLDDQLNDQAELFLSDTSRNRLENNTLYVSKIFDWYIRDFTSGWHCANSLNEFFLLYSDALKVSKNQRTLLSNNEINIEFLDYNWNLNNER